MNFNFALLCSVLLLLTACTPAVKEVPTVTEQVVEVPQPVTPEIIEEEPVPEQQDVLLILSSQADHYQKIADHLVQVLGKHASQITLTGQNAKDKAVINDIKENSATQIVAIGLTAAKAVKNIQGKQVVFAQVVNYKKNALVAENMKGVSALPSPEKLFKDWKQISPGLSKVAIVTGKWMDDYLARAEKAAKAAGIQLVIKKVANDKEFSYRSKNLKPDIEGQWILPDNHVLSAKALKEVMAHGSRRGRQIVVFSAKLLPFGGFFYVEPDEKAIAEVVLKRLSESAGEESIPGDSILPVMSHNMGINLNIARQLNLKIPEEYRKNINGE